MLAYCESRNEVGAVVSRSLKSLVKPRCAVSATLSVTCPSPPAHRMLFFSCTFWLDPVTSTAFAASSITVLFVSASVPPDVSTLSTQIPRVPLSYTRLLATVFVPKNIVRWIPVPLSYTVLPSTTTFPDPTPPPSPPLPYTPQALPLPPLIPNPLLFRQLVTSCTTRPKLPPTTNPLVLSCASFPQG